MSNNNKTCNGSQVSMRTWKNGCYRVATPLSPPRALFSLSLPPFFSVMQAEVLLREELERKNQELQAHNEGLQDAWCSLRSELEKVRRKREAAEQEQEKLARYVAWCNAVGSVPTILLF